MATATAEPKYNRGREVLHRARELLTGAKDGNPPRRPGVRPLLISLVSLFVIYLLIVLVALAPHSSGRKLNVNALEDAASSKDLITANFKEQDSRITGTLTGDDGKPVHYWASYPDASTNDLLRNFLQKDVEVTIDAQTTKAVLRFLAQFLLPLVIFANLFALLFLMVRSGGGASEFLQFSKVGDKQMGSDDKSRINFSNVAAADEAVVELAEVVDYLTDPESFARMGALPPKGVLLAGPPGCGKTLLARAVAGEAQANFYSISGSNFVESLVGVGAARVRDLFAQARASSPSILFIDELDAVGRQRGAGLGGGHDEREQTLNEMLVQMDGFSPTEGVAVLAATNRPDILDPALLRAGRFDRHITLERPDREGRLEILRLHARNKKLSEPDVDLPLIARNTPGFTGADLANVLNEAALLAVREKAQTIDLHHLDEAVDRVTAGPRRKGQIISAAERKRIAIHEAGHAVVAAALGQGSLVQKLSVVARGRSAGHLALLSDEKTVLTANDMEHQIAISMAGLAAEELLLGQHSTGSEVDLERATDTARDMAGRYGMSERLGRARVLKAQGEVFLGRDYMTSQEISQPTLEHLDFEVRRILNEQEAAARSILVSNSKVLDHLSTVLVGQETLQGPDLDVALARVRLHSNGRSAPRSKPSGTSGRRRPTSTGAADPAPGPSDRAERADGPARRPAEPEPLAPPDPFALPESFAPPDGAATPEPFAPPDRPAPPETFAPSEPPSGPAAVPPPAPAEEPTAETRAYVDPFTTGEVDPLDVLGVDGDDGPEAAHDAGRTDGDGKGKGRSSSPPKKPPGSPIQRLGRRRRDGGPSGSR